MAVKGYSIWFSSSLSLARPHLPFPPTLSLSPFPFSSSPSVPNQFIPDNSRFPRAPISSS